jgi:FixJ family two-component response regulator
VIHVPGTVHIVDDDASFRSATARLLVACGYAVETYESAEQLLARLPENPGAGCILLDIQMPGLTGPELQDSLSGLGSILPIIFLTGHADVATTVHVMKAGADDLLTKPVAMNVLVEALGHAFDRLLNVRAKHTQLERLRALVAKLTSRERQVFDAVVRGKMNKQIARELGTTERTIKAHRHRVMEKIEVTSSAELAVLAERLGIVA